MKCYLFFIPFVPDNEKVSFYPFCPALYRGGRAAYCAYFIICYTEVDTNTVIRHFRIINIYPINLYINKYLRRKTMPLSIAF